MKNTSIFDRVHNSQSLAHGSNIRGEYGESIASLFLIQHGFRISHPNGSHYPYDLIAERHGVSRRIQVKTCSIRSSVNTYRISFAQGVEFDDAIIVTDEGSIYVIPAAEMTFSSGCSTGSNRNRGRVKSKFTLNTVMHHKYLRGTFSNQSGGMSIAETISALESK